MLFSQRSRLGPPAFPESPVYPIAATTANSVNIFPQDRHLKTPRVHSYSVGRAALDRPRHGVRGPLRRQQEPQHVGGRELERAQHLRQRLLRRVQARAAQPHGEHRGRPRRRGFAYTGAPGTSPLPIHLAYLQRPNGNASNPAAYTSTNFTNAGVRQPLQHARPAGRPARWRRSTRPRSAPTRWPPACRAT